MSKTKECPDCGAENNVTEWRNGFRTSGQKDLECSDCNTLLMVEFYCEKCDITHGGRSALVSRNSGTKHYCPDCEGIIRKGELLDVTQGY